MSLIKPLVSLGSGVKIPVGGGSLGDTSDGGTIDIMRLSYLFLNVICRPTVFFPSIFIRV